MRLYTIQPQFVWDVLLELGYYHPFHNEQYADSLQDQLEPWDFINAYQWLRDQMAERNIEYRFNNSHMIWAWEQWGGANKKAPDLRFNNVRRAYTGEPYVLIEFEVDPKRVLLSDYDAWHFVLNYWELVPEKEKRQPRRYLPLSTPDIDASTQQTWQRIFNFEQVRNQLEFTADQQLIQATLFELFYTDVVKVHEFDGFGNRTQTINVRN